MKLKELLTVINTDTNIELHILKDRGLNERGQFEVYMILDGTKSRYKQYGNYEINWIEPDYDEYYNKTNISIYLFNSEIFELED